MKFTKKIIIGAIAALLAFSSIGCSMNKEEVYVSDWEDGGAPTVFTIHSDGTAELEFANDCRYKMTIDKINKNYWYFQLYEAYDLVNGEWVINEDLPTPNVSKGYTGVFIDDNLLLDKWSQNCGQTLEESYEGFISWIDEEYDFWLGKDRKNNPLSLRRKK